VAPASGVNALPRGNGHKAAKIKRSVDEMKKTFYSVTYRNWGTDSVSEAWFDNKKAADKFYDSRDYVDAPVVHRTSSPQKIVEYTELCNR
jgi:hypothetical protein